MEYIDAHVHVWTDVFDHYPIAESYQKSDMKPPTFRPPNVMVKVSAFYALGKKTPPYDDLAELVHRVYEAFGANRLMWASDCPYQVVDHTYEDSIGFVRDRLEFLSASDKDQILRKTAEDFFFQHV
jgi:predicted TIM-barrel fold metal-dependent hydrolase